MIKRVFVVGDSWANNYLDPNTLPHPFLNSKEVRKYAIGVNHWGHWLNHLSSFFEVHSFAIGGSSFEQIIYQLGNLPPFEKGDKLIMLFGIPDRFTWYVNNGVRNVNLKNLEIVFNRHPKSPQVRKIIEDQIVQRNYAWETRQETNNKKFINSIPVFFEQYSPLLMSWSSFTVEYTEHIHLIGNGPKYTTLEQESNGMCKDMHLGVKGNFELFKDIAELLELDISDYAPVLPEFKLRLT